MTTTVKIEDWKFTPQELQSVDKNGPRSAEEFFAELQSMVEYEGTDIMKEGNIEKVCYGLLENLAKIQSDEMQQSAEERTAFIMKKMMENFEKKKNDSYTENVKNTLIDESGEGFFTVTQNTGWAKQARNYTVGKNTGLYGTFAEDEIFGKGAKGAGGGKNAKLADFAEEGNPLSVNEIKTESTGKAIHVGGVTIDFKKELTIHGNINKMGLDSGLDSNTAHQTANAFTELVKEQTYDLQLELAEFLTENEDSIGNFVVGRTIGLFKLFEKMASLLLFGVEVKKRDKQIAIFKYTSANLYARLRYKKILEELKASWGKEAFPNISIKSKLQFDKVSLTTPGSPYATYVVDVSFKTGALETVDALGDFKMSTNLYADVYNIFSDRESKIAFFKAMYQFQDGNVAVNIEIKDIIKEMRTIKGQGTVRKKA